MNETVVPQGKPSVFAIWSAMLAIYIVWGSTYLAIRFAVETMPPFYMAAFRFVLAGTVLYGYRRIIAKDHPPTMQEWRSTAIVGLLLLLGGNGCVVWAEQRIPSGLAALLISSTPLWMILLEIILPGGKPPTRRAISGVILGFIGVLILFWPGSQGNDNQIVDILGAFVVILGSISWAMGSLYSRNSVLPKSPLLATSMEMIAGGVGLFVVGTIFGDYRQIQWEVFSTKSLISLGYLIVFGSLVGFAAYTWLLRVAPLSLVSTYAYVNPVVAIVIGSLIGSERLSPRILLAAAVILGAVILTTLKPIGRGPALPAQPAASRPPAK